MRAERTVDRHYQRWCSVTKVCHRWGYCRARLALPAQGTKKAGWGPLSSGLRDIRHAAGTFMVSAGQSDQIQPFASRASPRISRDVHACIG